MFLFLSRLFVVGFILISSVYAGAPAAWYQDPGNPIVMHIVDADGAVTDSKILRGESCGNKTVEIDGVEYTLPMQSKANESAVVQDRDGDVEMSEDGFEICPDSDTDVEMSVDPEIPDFQKSASSSAPNPTVCTYEAFFRDQTSSSDSETDSDSEQVSAGQKRKRDAGDKGKAPVRKKVRSSKYADVELKRIAYWRINPDKAGEFQLCDADGEVLYTGTVRFGKAGKKRTLQDGCLYINDSCNQACYYFRRDPEDTAVLKDHGFVEGSDESFRAYDAARKAGQSIYAGVEFDEVAYWRISPDQAGKFQLCDAKGEVLYTGTVRVGKAGKKRSLQGGRLHIFIAHDQKTYNFKRDPKDTAILKDHGFVEGSDESFRVYGAANKAGQFRKMRPSKYDGVELEKVAYWRINPDQAGEFQLCDAEGEVVYTGRVSIGKEDKKRTLNNGYLNINDAHNSGKYYSFKRDPEDIAILEDHGFVEGSDEFFRVHDAAKKAGQLKYAGVEFDKVAYWRINPDQAGEFQLCDAEGEVVYTGRVSIGKEDKKRTLNNGYLNINDAHNSGKYYSFKRDPEDIAILEDHGFVEGSDEFFRVHDAAKKAGQLKYAGVEFDKVAYWRINPDQAGEFQLCDKDGKVLYTGSIRIGKEGEERELHNGLLRVRFKGVFYSFYRDPKDRAVLKDHGFAAGQKAFVWRKETEFDAFLSVRKPSWMRR